MTTWQTKTSLYPHQYPAVSKLIRSRVGGLFMDMGTGKTRVAIELACLRQHKIDRVVWFCPTSLKETVAHEIRKHADTGVYVFNGRTCQGNVPYRTPWHVVGIEAMSSSNRAVMAANSLITSRTFVIVDESSYIKTHHALRTRRITALSERARYRLILTGTPMTLGYQDLYAQMRFLSAKILGYSSFYSFAANHLEFDPNRPGLVVRAHNTDWLAAKINPYVYQITKEDAGINLPAKLFDRRIFRLTATQVEAYEQAKWEILIDNQSDLLETYVIFRLFTALQQITSGFWLRDGVLHEYQHYRLKTLCQIIKDLPDGEKVIIWCKYRYSVRQITEILTEQYGLNSVAQFYGDLDEAQRASQLQCWRNTARFLVATMATGGHGLTLNEAAYAVFYENEFNYAHRIQAEDRNHRLGQTRRPTYIDIASDAKIEDRIATALARKENIAYAFRRAVQEFKGQGRDAVKGYLAKNL